MFKLNFITFTVYILALLEFDSFNCQLTMKQKLDGLRSEMKKHNCEAYIIPSEDEHQSEYVADYDKRRAWITDFTGSAGTAVVTKDKGLLWTDSRYYIQADDQLDKTYWTMMRAADPGTQRIEEYLASKLSANNNVCQNPKLVSISTWKNREKALNASSINLIGTEDLIDIIWPTIGIGKRPSKPKSKIFVHGIEYAGITVDEKIKLIQAEIVKENAEAYVVTALDEVAWLFNLRASDIPYNPMFFAYAIISATGDDNRLFVDSSREDFDSLRADHLNRIKVFPYEQIMADITDLSKTKKIWISPTSSYAIYNTVSESSLINNKQSPVKGIKAIKNNVEIQNFRNCQLRDSAARIRHMYELETMMKNGTKVTEKSAAKMLEKIQSEDKLYHSLSFESISAVGKNAAIVHYATSEGDDSVLEKQKVYLLDAGAQYTDGTTDITRTLHFGTPSSKEILAYTRVLQGSIDLSNIYFPEGVQGNLLDVQARASLWRVGLDYGHGTGHGIGYFLSVHEAPPGIAYSSRANNPIQIGMVSSDEPGYYEAGEFGIRLETDIEVVEATTPYTYGSRKTLKFEAMTLVPFERKLINECDLTMVQVKWLNDYNGLIREKIRPMLSAHPAVQEYLDQQTESYASYYRNSKCYNSASQVHSTFTYLFLAAITFYWKNSL